MGEICYDFNSSLKSSSKRGVRDGFIKSANIYKYTCSLTDVIHVLDSLDTHLTPVYERCLAIPVDTSSRRCPTGFDTNIFHWENEFEPVWDEKPV